MSTKIPWFRYGFRETKRWLRNLTQKKHPCRGEIVEALERCVKNREEKESDHCEYCGEKDYGCAVDKDGACLKWKVDSDD